MSFAQDLSRADLETDVMRHSAILYQIEIMGKQRSACLKNYAISTLKFPGEMLPECGTSSSTNMTGLILMWFGWQFNAIFPIF